MRKKILSLLSTICMIVAMVAASGVSVFALEAGATQTVTVNNLVAGTTVSAYKVINLNVSSTGSIMDPTYTWADEVAEWVGDNYTSYVTNTNEVTSAFTNSADLDAFWYYLGQYVNSNTSSFGSNVPSETVQPNGTSANLTLGMGEYVLLANGGTNKIYLPASVAVLPEKDSNGEFNLDSEGSTDMKGSDITVDKDIPNEDDKTVGIGSVVNYVVTNTIPSYPSNVDKTDLMYKIGDNMSGGLTFNGEVEVLLDGSTVNAQGNYSIRTEGLTNSTFEVVFTPDFILGSARKKITLKYSATVNENAVNEDIQNPLDNTVTLTYSNDPYDLDNHKEITDKEKVFTYNIQFDKVDSSNEKLKNAIFTLSKNGENTPLNLVEESAGVYRLAKTEETGITSTLTSSTGVFLIKGLDTGTYVLEETKSPEGYVLPANSKVTITLTDTDPDGDLDAATTASGTSVVQNSVTKNGLSISFDIVNNTAEELKLPVTGGTGIMMFTISGVILMGGAVLLYVNNRRKNLTK